MVANLSTQERRKNPRYAANVPLKIFQEDGDIITETGNISRCGAYCRVNRYIAPMSKLNIHLLLPLRKNGRNVTRKVTCEGIIVRTEQTKEKDQYNIAIFFNTISQRDADNIADYVSSCLEQNEKK